MSHFPEIDIFEKSSSQRCILDVEATGALAIENQCEGINGYTAENVSFNPALQAFELGDVPCTLWFDQFLPLQRFHNFRIQARIRLNSATGLNVPIISCQDGYPTYRGWNLRVADKVYFSMVAEKTYNILKISCDLPSIGTEHLIEVVSTYSGGVQTVQILYDGVPQATTLESNTLTSSILYTYTCTFIGCFTSWSGWTPGQRGCVDTIRDVRVEINGFPVFDVPGNEFNPGRIYNRITGEDAITLRMASRDIYGRLGLWFKSSSLRFTLPADFDTREFTFACWCEYDFTGENQEMCVWILDAVEVSAPVK
jgi:hypothetical protein